MVSYKINVESEKAEDFFQIIQSLKNIGVIVSFEPIVSLGLEGERVSTKTLLSVLDKSKKDIENGHYHTVADAKKIAKTWKKK